MEFVEFFLELDKHLAEIIKTFGVYTYAILFLIIFAETGLVITPFLPGDSLLFVVGSIAGGGFLNVWVVYVTLLIAAILGDTVNYWVGHHIGPKVFKQKDSKIFKKAYLEKTREFYAKYGGKTIIIARFVPIVRTFAPFVAGIGSMRYSTFIFYNIAGALLWITSLVFAGFFFGSLPIVKENFEYAVIIIIFISLIPILIEYIKHKGESHSAKSKKELYKDIKKRLK